MPAMTTEALQELGVLKEKAGQAVRLLRLLANENRLLLLCHLVAEGEMTVRQLAEAVDLSQPAVSQHLALFREEGLVATRKESQAVFYRLIDMKAARMLVLLRELYCQPAAKPKTRTRHERPKNHHARSRGRLAPRG